MIQFDPRSLEFRSDPYSYYSLLRRHAPIYLWNEWNTTFVSRHEDCSKLLRDSRIGHGGMGEPTEGQVALHRMQANWLLVQDPPSHTRLRGLVFKAFTPRMVERLRTTIEQLTDQCLDALARSGGGDLMATLAHPLPVAVIAEMFGIPARDRDRFTSWSDKLARTLDLTDDPAVYQRASLAAETFTAYLTDLAARRRVEPGDDLLSALVLVEEEGEHLTADELYATCALLLIAGHETTVNLIGNGTLALLRHPRQRDLLLREPDLIQSAVEELLRYDGPVQMTSRIVLQDVELRGHTFRAGASLNFLLGAANRDAAVFTDPDRLDITRRPNPHLGFGSGIHYCLGAPLARLEGQIAIGRLLRRFPNLHLATESVRYRDNFVLRGLRTLPVAL